MKDKLAREAIEKISNLMGIHVSFAGEFPVLYHANLPFLLPRDSTSQDAQILDLKTRIDKLEDTLELLMKEFGYEVIEVPATKTEPYKELRRKRKE